MTTRRTVWLLLSIAFFAAAIAAWVEMQMLKAFATDFANGIHNELRKSFILGLFLKQPPPPMDPHIADEWFWIAVGCFVCGVISFWRLLRKAKQEQRV